MKKKIIILFLLLPVIWSCDDILDPIPNGSNTEKWIWSKRDNVRFIVNNIYNKFEQDYDFVSNSFIESATDDAFHSLISSPVHHFVNNAWGPTNIPYNIWKDRYEGIRKANYILTNIDAPVVDGESIPTPFTGDNIAEKERFKGEAYFLRGLLYFDIAKCWGGGFIVNDAVYTLSDINEAVDLKQVRFAEIAAYIVEQCDRAIALLPSVYSGTLVGSRGRATKEAAVALKARVLLYLASPLYNESSNTALWANAANAAKAAIDDTNYGLFKGNSVDNTYYNIFRVPYVKEVIFASKVTTVNSLESRNFPPGLQGNSYTQPSEDLVKAFPMANGKMITDPTAGYDPSKPYLSRDPRFYSFILYNGATFKGTVIETFTGGKDGPDVSLTSTKTGYYLKKLLSANVDLVENKSDKINTVLFRFTELLLNYAEAMNEAYGPEVDPGGKNFTALAAINQIRSRVNTGQVPTGLSKADFRELVKNERRIELCFEGHRFFDVRRWKEGEKYLGKPLNGVKVTKNSDGTFSYSNEIVQQRSFRPAMYHFPFPYSEIVKFNGSLTQNTGW
jgi:starch-binding outer membrane protein, SusD/RagB family